MVYKEPFVGKAAVVGVEFLPRFFCHLSRANRHRQTQTVIASQRVARMLQEDRAHSLSRPHPPTSLFAARLPADDQGYGAT